MLRFVVLLLILLNGLYFVWSHEYLRTYGFGPAPSGEPQRLERQIRPESIRILPAKEAQLTATSTPAPAKPAECLQAGLFDERQAQTLRQALGAALPAQAWSLETVTEPARWIVYMGPYLNPEALVKKRKELSALKISPEPVDNPKLEPGLTLGRFGSKPQAEAALEALKPRGIQTARVVLERAEVTGALLKLPAVDEAMRARLNDLSPLPISKPLQNCA